MARVQGTKVVVMGGGSSYTPEIVEGLIGRAEELSLRDVWLVDIPAGEEKLSVVGALAKRMVRKAKAPFKVRLTVDRREALPEADFVVTQIRVGGIAARIKDERVPLKHGVMGQETVGPGGFAKALRTVPQVLAICRDMVELCPNAWLINFTQSERHRHRSRRRHGGTNVVGLQHPRSTPSAASAPVQRQARGDGHPVRRTQPSRWLNRATCRGVTSPPTGEASCATQPAGPIDRGDRRHPRGYHNYYYSPDKATEHLLQAQRSGKPTRGEQIVRSSASCSQYRKRTFGGEARGLPKRGARSTPMRRCAHLLHLQRPPHIHAWTRGTSARFSDLPADSVVEVNCAIDRQGRIPSRSARCPATARPAPAGERLRGADRRCAITGECAGARRPYRQPHRPQRARRQPLLDDLLSRTPLPARLLPEGRKGQSACRSSGGAPGFP
jgi:6-phospho-beta-glucosidase